MKYFKDSNNSIYAYADDGSEDEFIKKGLIEITEKEALAIVNPPPTREELIATAETEKQIRIGRANDYMNGKQWPGKAAIGRLKGDELAQYNLWLDYLDELYAIETASTPDINWPAVPQI